MLVGLVGDGCHWLMVLVATGHCLLVVLVDACHHLLLVLVHVHGLWSLFLGVGGGWPWFMMAVVTEDGGGKSFMGSLHPCHLCSFGGGGAGTWASLSWYVIVVVHLFATSAAVTWHLGSEQ